MRATFNTTPATALAAFALASTALAVPAMAADPVPFEPAFEPAPAPQRSVLLGIGAAVAPLYEGSDEYRVAPFPIIAPDFGGDGPRRFEFRALDDIRLHALRLGGFNAGVLGGYRFGREEDDADRLRGLGDVDGGVVAGGFVGYDFAISPNAVIGADVAISTQVTGDAFDEDAFGGLPIALRDRIEDNYGYGYTVDFGVSGEFDITPRLNLAARVGAEYASDEYMRTYFGVNGAQAIAATDAGNPIRTFGTPAGPTRFGAGVDPATLGPRDQFASDIDGQVKNVYLNANVTFDVTDSVQVRAGAGYSHLLGDASDSPISVTDHQFTGSLGVAYRIRF